MYLRRLALPAVFIFGSFACGGAPESSGRTASPVTETDVTSTPPLDYQQRANETHDFVVGHLLTSSGSYRTAAGEDRTDEWHDVSQLGADAEMFGLGDARYLPYVDATATFLDDLWDHASPSGGYFATSRADGSDVATDAKYVDDNSLAGVTWLDARDAIGDPARKDAYLASARAVANFLMTSGVWDDTYGGGFYWSTQKPDKPTQSNGLALQLFVRLSSITNEPYYADWAASLLSWLDGAMFDASTGLYSWKWEAAGRNDAKFTYDQAILVDAHLLLYAQTNDPAHLARAQTVADAMHATLWDDANGGYVISTEDRRLSPAFSAWASCSLVRLYEADGDPRWLDRARANVAALDDKLRSPADFGYLSASSPDGSGRSDTQQEVDQAWMQRAQAMLARAALR